MPSSRDDKNKKTAEPTESSEESRRESATREPFETPSTSLTAGSTEETARQDSRDFDRTSRLVGSATPRSSSKEGNPIEAQLRKGNTTLLREVILPYVIAQINKSNINLDAKTYCVTALTDLTTAITQMGAIDINKLVRKPKMFSGRNEHPKLWIEEYLFCCDLNSWSPEQVSKYFPAFLEGSALRWYIRDVKPKLNEATT